MECSVALVFVSDIICANFVGDSNSDRFTGAAGPVAAGYCTAYIDYLMINVVD